MAREYTDSRDPYLKIAAEIRRKITRGDLAPGAKLPTVKELMEQFGSASNTTIQKALAVLKEEEIIEGRPGKGVFVRPHGQQPIEPMAYMAPASAGKPYKWMTEAARNQQVGGAQLLDVAVVSPPAEVAAALELEEGEQALVRKLVLTLDGQPTELTRSYYPLGLSEGTPMMERRRIKGGTPTLLNEMGFPPREFIDDVSAEIPTEEEAVALELPKGMPVLVAFRVVYSDGGRPIEATLMTKAAHRYRMRYRLQVPQGEEPVDEAA
ncbi:GntR family transcriptional regulator [Streptomyces sp. NPDC056508]|uniref:GntR family transcriptional regulator n=1 Tax=Streptomyces sp. NPDC056508 TaxID=3345845 RepID=UPI0036C3458A